MSLLKSLFIILVCSLSFSKVIASEDHGHDDEKHEQDEEEANSNMGPDKGIVEYDEANGFKLSAEAIKNFELKTLRLVKAGPWSVPSSAALYSAEEINLFRVRDGFYKRIDFTTDKKTPTELIVRSKELKENDEIVIHGVGFLRTAEIVATGGAPEGHSH